VRKLNSLTSGFARPIEMIDTSPLIADTEKTTTCYMCACRCGIRVHPSQGRPHSLHRCNHDHPVNRGVVCAKGSAGIMNHHSPDRLSKPLLRTGERGRGDFKEIEWEEALTLASIADVRCQPRSNVDASATRSGHIEPERHRQQQALSGHAAKQVGGCKARCEDRRARMDRTAMIERVVEIQRMRHARIHGRLRRRHPQAAGSITRTEKLARVCDI
jgi:Molybdopterin oxidoreductase Fe4S4 domain/Molybdopterin oxidoreductase